MSFNTFIRSVFGHGTVNQPYELDIAYRLTPKREQLLTSLNHALLQGRVNRTGRHAVYGFDDVIVKEVDSYSELFHEANVLQILEQQGFSVPCYIDSFGIRRPSQKFETRHFLFMSRVPGILISEIEERREYRLACESLNQIIDRLRFEGWTVRDYAEKFGENALWHSATQSVSIVDVVYWVFASRS